ncbi:ubiquinone biosynthesis regulatory protein kinase UbiB [Veronia pacifica]|uniref:Probable protein kinase UbiB n=1 Tax=Veronia pacifica TaxID=1080227 RepID=A0A1C3EJK6_9GAMM|nr:ubiquinone biosynthesis regulatory protein kinase UbiB [Veronia pacifica]ODA33409.1 ubiquinone biosynthesis regulatory protein kinase UbiB [Veronia pacifica]
MRLNEIRRLYKIIRVHLEYGLDELVPDNSLTRWPHFLRRGLFWLKNKHSDKEEGDRLRLALQELGPVWIKFGQMLSTRRDLFPDDIADQLALLQDQVMPFDSKLAKEEIEKALGGPVETWFDDFEMTPLASASIAQVHVARLRENGREVVLKVIRPDILPVIQSDIKLMYRMAGILSRFLPVARRLRPVEVVHEYEKTLINELDLLREAANAIQMRRNFDNNPILYVPEVFSDFSHKNLMVSERIYGIGVSDIDTLTKRDTNLKLLAERGVEIFFSQVFRDSFFHADMHPGNLFVSYDNPDDPTWIGLDCGIVGTLNREDKRYLAENLLAFFNRDYRKVAELHVDSGWVPADTNVDEFEFAIRTVCEPIFEKPLGEISFGHVLVNLFSTARQFDMEVQPQLVLLEKTLLYVEGLGRQLYPQLNLWETAKPFLEDWMSRQVGPKAVLNAIKEKAPFWAETLPELPELVYDSLRQGKAVSQRMDEMYGAFLEGQRQQNRVRFLLGIGASLLITSAILFTHQIETLPEITCVTALGSWLFAWRAANK